MGKKNSDDEAASAVEIATEPHASYNPRLEVVPLSALIPDDINLNQGSARGQALLERSIEDYGFGRSLLLDKKGKLIAGNKTYDALAANGGFEEVIVVKTNGRQVVAVQRTDLDLDTDVEARELGAADNLIQKRSFQEDPESMRKLSDLGVDFSKWYREHELKEIYTPVEYEPVDMSLAREEHTLETTNGIVQFREDAIFSSSNFWGIPDLREDMLSNLTPHETWPRGEEIEDSRDFFFVYGSGRLPERGRGGVLAFYAYDNVFEQVWHDAVAIAERFVNYGWGALVAPDFSIGLGDPIAFQLWQVYRARWVARFWQEAGLKVIPNLSSGDKRTYDFCFETLPKKCPVVSLQVRSTSKKFTGIDQDVNRAEILRDFSAGIEIVQPQTVLIYGGTEGRSWFEPGLPKGPEYIWLDSFTKAREKAGKIVRKKDKKKAAATQKTR